MAFVNNRPGYGNTNTYYESEKDIIRGPRDSYASEYRVQEHGNPEYSVLPQDHRHHNPGGYSDRVSETEVVTYESNPGYLSQHHQHGRPAELIERREEVAYEKPRYDSTYNRLY